MRPCYPDAQPLNINPSGVDEAASQGYCASCLEAIRGFRVGIFICLKHRPVLTKEKRIANQKYQRIINPRKTIQRQTKQGKINNASMSVTHVKETK